MTSARSFTFTSKDTGFWTAELINVLKTKSEIRFVTYQINRNEHTGELYTIGYVELTITLRAEAVKRLLGDATALVEKRQGKKKETLENVRKTQNRVAGPFECGDLRKGGQGRRNDLFIVQEKIDSGVPMETIAKEHFATWVKYQSALEKYKAMNRT